MKQVGYFFCLLGLFGSSGCVTSASGERPTLSSGSSPSAKTKNAPQKGEEEDLAISKPQGPMSSVKSTGKLPAGALKSEEDDTAEADVVVDNGMVCVPEGSPQALQLSQILEASSSEEDLDHALNDPKSNQVGSITLMEKEQAVQNWIQYFTVRDKERFTRFLDRGNRFKDVIFKILKEEGVPTEIYYLAMIESGFVTYAKSHASAVGVWQFIKGTGLRYGLRINSFVDERHDPIRSTRAAARYLASLYRVYQSWELAMAAYNSGEGRVLGAIMRGHTRDFWELAKGGYLPKETADYVPKFMAAALIGKNIEKYDFDLNPEPAMSVPVPALVPAGVRLTDIARTTGISHDDLSSLNPHLRKGVTPSTSNDQYYIWVPEGSEGKLAPATAELQRARIRLKRDVEQEVASKPSTPERKSYHKVRSGDTLAAISAKYNVSMTTLRSLNGLRSSRVYVGQKIKLVSQTRAAATHVVKPGDTIERLASRYGTTPDEIKKLNRISSSRLRTGQVIQVPKAG
jgi:membrane-bound lytic murein transglycosylase D